MFARTLHAFGSARTAVPSANYPKVFGVSLFLFYTCFFLNNEVFFVC